MGNKLNQLLDKADALLNRLDTILPTQTQAVDWDVIAWRWVKHQHTGFLESVPYPDPITLDQIQFSDIQKTTLTRNTQQFLQGLPANHALLTGARGTGKSSLVKALLNAYAEQGLRLIEVDKYDLVDLPQIVQYIRDRKERFIIFCDDLSFEAHDASYKALKVILDGSIASPSDNVLVYATSNRKNLMPEFHADNVPQTDVDGEIRPNDTIEEKTALSERFGLWLPFHAFDQNAYLSIAAHWLNNFGLDFDAQAEKAALDFSYARGARSGRLAYQFAKDYAGAQQLQKTTK